MGLKTTLTPTLSLREREESSPLRERAL